MIKTIQLNIDGTTEDILKPRYNDLNEWQKMQYMIRFLLESHGITQEYLTHTFENTGTAYDSGLIDYKRFYEELNKPKTRKTRKKG